MASKDYAPRVMLALDKGLTQGTLGVEHTHHPTTFMVSLRVSPRDGLKTSCPIKLKERQIVSYVGLN